MEQEPEEAHQAVQALDFDNKVRAEINVGFQEIRNIEDQLRNAPQGFLGRADGTDAQVLRANILGASAAVVGSFTKIISLLSAYSSRNGSLASLDRHGSGGESGVGGGAERRSDSPMSSTHMRGSTPPASPHRGPSGNPACSPSNTPLSGSGMSDGSPPNPVSSPLSLDYDVEAASGSVGASGRIRQAAPNEGSTSADHDLSEHPAPRKRKFMPKYSIKQRGTGTDLGSDGPPEDGFTWRKYGQKDILGSKYPRSYYRCTRKNDDGCPAIKNVQRSDEDPSMFDVTYRGTHTCQPTRQYPSWPFSVPPELFARILAESRERQPTRELTLQDFSGRGGSGIVAAEDPINGLSPIIALPRQGNASRLDQAVFGTSPLLSTGVGGSSSMGMRMPVKPEVNNPSQQRISNIANASTDTFFESTSNILLKKSMPFPTLSGQSEGHSSSFIDNSMPLPAVAAVAAAAPAGRMDNQCCQLLSPNLWAGLSTIPNSRWGEDLQQSSEFRPPHEQLDDPAGLYRFAGGSPSISDSEYSHPIDPTRGPGQQILPIEEVEAYVPPGTPFFESMEYEQMMSAPFPGISR